VVATKKLSAYQAKRDFTLTKEPRGEAEPQAGPRPRFVVQKHAATRLHYDLQLELDGGFKSWAVAKGPSLDPYDKRLVVEVEDRPLDYGDFEGTIPQGQYAIIDGEIVALDAYGAPDFAALQAALSEGNTANLVFFVFDLLFAGGEDLRPPPLSDRKSRLQKVLAALPQQGGPLLRYVDHFETGGED
jgi:DNA ligase D-like protein (predicted 3'-phosphoesterase)